MRITQGMMMNKYSKNLNINLGRMNRTSQQIETGRRFQRASEDPMRAVKSLQIRRSLASLEQYHSNIEAAEMWLTQTEVSIASIKSHADKMVDLVIQGKNDTNAPEDRLIIATAMRQIQDALLKDLNTQVGGRYIFGGANTKVIPFSVDSETGHLMFNGENVFEAESMADFESLETPIYVDLTGDFQYGDDDEIVDYSTVFNLHTPGVEVIGIGPYNLYNLIGRIAYSFESEHNPTTIEFDGLEHIVNDSISRMKDLDGPITDETLEESRERLENIISDPLKSPEERAKAEYELNLYLGEEYNDDATGLFKRLQEVQLNTIISLAVIGERYNYVSYLKDRNEDYTYHNQVMQSNLETIPPDEAIMKFKMDDYVYKACLQMGTYIFQPSLMDYIKR